MKTNRVKRAAAIAIPLAGVALYSGAVIAQSLGPAAGPSWEVIAVGTWGLLTTVIGVVAMTWTAAISSRIKEQEVKLSEVNDRIRDKYHDKDELRELLFPIKQQLEEVAKTVHQINITVAGLSERVVRRGDNS